MATSVFIDPARDWISGPCLDTTHLEPGIKAEGLCPADSPSGFDRPEGFVSALRALYSPRDAGTAWPISGQLKFDCGRAD